MKVWLCELVKEWDTWEWLCKACAIARRTVRNQFGHLIWSRVTPIKVIPGVNCSDCEKARQAAPGYVTPTVDYVPTSPQTFHPARRAAA